MSQDQWWYFVTLGILALLLWMARNLVAGRTGRAIRAMRDHPSPPRPRGIDLAHYTALTFAVGAAYAGIAGALAALLLDFIAPESFTYWLSILLLVGSVFGGMTSVWGAVVGGLFLQFWPDIAGMVSRDLVHPVFGALLVLSMRFMPGGVAGMVAARRPAFSTPAQMTPSAFSFASSSAPSPHTLPRISALCSPSSGARVTSVDDAESRMGLPGVAMRPRVGCSTSTIMPRPAQVLVRHHLVGVEDGAAGDAGGAEQRHHLVLVRLPRPALDDRLQLVAPRSSARRGRPGAGRRAPAGR